MLSVGEQLNSFIENQGYTLYPHILRVFQDQYGRQWQIVYQLLQQQ